MKYELIITSNALLDLEEIVDWYETQKKDLGIEFADVANKGVKRIGKNPFLFNCVYKNFRRSFVEKFPYKIYYSIVKNKILIIGIFHNSRDTKTIFNFLKKRY